MSTDPHTSATSGAGGTSERLAAINDPSLDELRAEWRRLYRSPPPRLSLDLMRRAIAYRIQEKAFGGLSPASRRSLKQLTAQLASSGRVTPEPRQTARPGARLVREWNGRTYTVTVTEDGFDYAGLGRIPQTSEQGTLTRTAPIRKSPRIRFWEDNSFYGHVGCCRNSDVIIP